MAIFDSKEEGKSTEIKPKPPGLSCKCSVVYDIFFFVSADGTDFVDPAQRISFSQSGQISCADVEILRDNTDELNETFTMELIFNYAPFDIPLDTLEVTIVDSGELTVDGTAISAYIWLHNHETMQHFL